jgi:hypothetical protein
LCITDICLVKPCVPAPPPNLLGSFFAARIYVIHSQPRAVFGERQGYRLSNTLPSTRDQRHSVLQIHLHGRSSFNADLFVTRASNALPELRQDDLPPTLAVP